MTKLENGPRQNQTPATAPAQDLSLDVGLGGREILDQVLSFGSHPLLGDAGAVVEAIRTGSCIIARTAPGTEVDDGKQVDSPATGYSSTAKHLVFESQPVTLGRDHDISTQSSAGMMVEGRGVRFGSSAAIETEQQGREEDSVARVVVL